MKTRLSVVCALALPLVFAVSCTDEEDGENEDECPPGQTAIEGTCVRTGGGTGGGDEDGGSTDDANPGNYNEAECGDEGCAEGEFCFEGRCRKGSKCEPGKVFGCYDDKTRRVCPPKGLGFTLDPCPGDKPNCLDVRKEGCDEQKPECFETKCTSQKCVPDEKFCDENVAKKCNSEGTEAEVIEECRGGCEDGECVSACEGNAKSYLGCGFYAVDLDNFTVSCNQDSQCGSCITGGLFGAQPCSGGSDCFCRRSSGQSCEAVTNPCSGDAVCAGGACRPSCSTAADCGTCQSDGVCQRDNANAKQFGVTVANTTGRSLNLDIFKGPGSENPIREGTLSQGALETFKLPQFDTDNTELSNKFFRLQADGPITAHQFNPLNESGVKSNDASLLLPASAMGSDYRVVGWKVPSSMSPSEPQEMKAYITILAVESTPQLPKTEVTVANNPAKIIGGDEIDPIPANSDGKTFTLEQGDVLQLAAEKQGGNDLTGTTIKTRGNRIAVFSGNEAANVPADTPFADHLEQQLFPTSTWGHRYVLSKFEPRGEEDDIFRIIPDLNETKIVTKPEIDGVHGRVIGPNESTKTLTFRTDQSVFVKGVDANPEEGEDPRPKPIAVGQFMVGSSYPGPNNGCTPGRDESNCKVTRECDDRASRIGDPAFSLNVPTTQFRNDYVVNTPEGYQEDYINIIAPSDASVQLDGNVVGSADESVSTPDGDSWQIIRQSVEPGVHRVKADQPVGLSSYGYECDVSYAYPGGLDLSSDVGGRK